MATPDGKEPTGIVATTVLLAVAITETSLELRFVTYAKAPFGVMATETLYRSHGAEVFRTCRDGAVTIRIGEDGEISAEGYRRRKEGKDGKVKKPD